MSLWLRFVLALLMVALPAAVTTLFVMQDLEWRNREESLANTALRVMQAGGRLRCEAAPEQFGGPLARPQNRRTNPGRGRPRAWQRREAQRRSRLEFWAYDSELLSRNPRAPVLAKSLADQIEDGEVQASRRVSVDESAREAFEVLVRMPWWPDGPCAALLVRDTRGTNDRQLSRALWAMLAVVAASALGIGLAAWPVVRRLRRLADGVRGTAREFDLHVDVRGRDELKILESAFREVHERIREQMRGLVQREEALRSFVRNTMHDVMVPLSVLQGYLARGRDQAGASEETRVALAGAVQEAEYVRSLLENLHTFARIEADALPLRESEVELGSLVERVVGRLRVLGRSRDVDLDFGLPGEECRTNGDVVLLEQALGNLVHNAVVYSNRGDSVLVLLEDEDEGEGQERSWVLRVLDTGPGLDPAEREQVLEPRIRGREGRSRNPSGTGLGLHIVREIAARHGARVEIRDRDPGPGLEVRIAGLAISS